MIKELKFLVLSVAMTMLLATVAYGQAAKPADDPKAAGGEPAVKVDPNGAALGVLLRRSEDIVTVVGVIPGSGAAKAGIRWGDVLTSLGTKPITRIRQVTAVLDNAKPGEQIDVKVSRKGQLLDFKATLGKVESTFGKGNQGLGGTASAPQQSALTAQQIAALNQQVYLLNQQIDLLHRQLNQVQAAPVISTPASNNAKLQDWWNDIHHGEADDDPALFQ